MKRLAAIGRFEARAWDGSIDTSVVAPRKASKTLTAYGLITEDGLDGIEYGQRNAKREAKDLKDMGCEVKVLMVVGADIDGPLDMVHEAVRSGKAVGKALLAKVNAAYPMSTITVAKGF